MIKPNNYESTKEYGSFEQLPPGNYECRIKEVIETTSKTNKPMLQIHLDIASGEYAGFFAEQYKDDTRQDKKWPCIVYQLTEDNDGNCSRGLKTFINAVAASNYGFDVSAIWGDAFCNFFKNKLVGSAFRREQYENRSGELRWSVKSFRFFAADTVADQPEPEDKPLVKKERPSYFRPVEDDDTGLPW